MPAWFTAIRDIYLAGVKLAQADAIDFLTGVTGSYNTETGRLELSVAGGGSGHTIEDEGTPLTPRASLNFVGVNVSVADSGGKTVVTVGAVSLAGSGVTGTLPVARGGTGLGTVGTALQVLRTNAAADGLEWATPAAGLTTPGGDGFRYTYSTTTTDADPGAGTFRANHATLSSATLLYVDLAEFGTTDVTAWLDSLDDNVGTIKGRIRLASMADPTKWIVYNLTAWTTATGYRKLTVAYVAGPGNLPTTAGDIFLSFDSGPVGGITNTEVATGAAITLAKLADGAARSIVGTAGAAGAHTDIGIGTNGFVVLRRSDSITGALLLDENVDAAAGIAVTKLGNLATDKLLGRDTAGTGAVEAIGVGHGVEFDGSANIRVAATIPARGTENVAVDLLPNAQSQGTVATAASVTFDVAIAASKRYKITADCWVDDGAGGAVLFTKSLLVNAHQTGGVAVKVTESVLDDNAGAGFTFAASVSTTNIRFTLSNTSGSTRSYNVVIGYVVLDKP